MSHPRDQAAATQCRCVTRTRRRETDEITWVLKIERKSEALEATLLKLRDNLRGWYGLEWGKERDNLTDEITHIKTSVEIDKIVEELAQEKRDFYEDYPLPILSYRSQRIAALYITQETRTAPTITVATGWEPPQTFSEKFVERHLVGIDYVTVDRRQVWSRCPDKLDDEIPF